MNNCIFCDIVKKKILVVCYHGNNGGDGFVAARYLSNIANVKVWFIGDKKKLSKEAALNFNKLPKKIFAESPRLNSYHIIVDAILGIGARSPLNKKLSAIVAKINASRALKVSIDVPTGFDFLDKNNNKGVDADLVVAMHDMKEGTGALIAKTEIVDIGLK